MPPARKPRISKAKASVKSNSSAVGTPHGYAHKYNLYLPTPLPDWQLELRCWAENVQTDYDSFYHLKNALKLMWPENVWHPWREQRMVSFCDPALTIREGSTIVRVFSWMGCGAAAKAQPLDSIVVTPTGFKPMGKIQVGDRVCSPNGETCEVVGVFPQGPKDVYEITLSDGTQVRASKDHLWYISDKYWDQFRLVDTAYLLKHHRRYSNQRTELAIPFSKPVYFDPRPVEMDPYLLGVLLGDGCLGGRCGKGPLSISSGDQEILQRITSLIGEDYRLVRRKESCDYGISKSSGEHQGKNRHIQVLKSYGLWGTVSDNKFIPKDYLFNSEEIRREILRGLMDTDGTVEKGNAVFCTCSHSLAMGVKFLVQSLGGCCSIAKHKSGCWYKGSRRVGADSYKLYVQTQDASELFHLTRKRAKCRPRTANGRGRMIVDVKLVGQEEVQCIKVSNDDGLYLTDGFTVTHNTFDAVLLALSWWLANPANSIVTMTSTTKEASRQRMWAVLQTLYYDFQERHGVVGPHPINSAMMLEAYEGERKHAIYVQAVESGELTKAIANLQGRHAPRMFLVVDEAMGTPDAVFAAIPNLFKGAQEVNLLFLSNAPLSRHNPFMRLAEPVGGWNAVKPDYEQWPTKPIDAWQIPRGTCLHFSGQNSPNVKAGKTIYPFLYSLENWRRVEGNAEIAKTPQFWSQDLGFPPPEGALFTVLTESLIESRDATGKHTFISWAKPVAGLDPSFGNDECKLVFGVMGDLMNGLQGVQVAEHMTILIDVEAKDKTGRKIPPEYQIARKVMDECVSRNIPPERLGVMAGGNPGVIGVLKQEWGEIVTIEESGSASELPASSTDPRPSNEVYDRRVSELYFLVRSLVEGGQLKGLYEDAVQQLCARLYDVEKSKRRKAIEKKEDFKPRFGRSPDDAEAIIAMCCVARELGVEPLGLSTPKPLKIDNEAEEENSINNLYDEDTRQNDPFDGFMQHHDQLLWQ